MEGSLVGKKYLGISKLINKRIESPGSAKYGIFFPSFYVLHNHE